MLVICAGKEGEDDNGKGDAQPDNETCVLVHISSMSERGRLCQALGLASVWPSGIYYHPMDYTVKKLPKSQIELSVTADTEQFTKAKEAAYQKLAPHISLPGFRPGKAPRATLELALGDRLLSEAINLTVQQALFAALTKEELQPLDTPRVTVEKFADQLVSFKAIFVVWPQVTVKDYRHLKLAKPQVKPITDQDQESDLVDALLAKTTVEVPELFVSDELNRMLVRLSGDLERSQTTLVDWLSLQGKKPEDFRQELTPQAEKNVRIQLALSAVAKEEHIEATDEEVKKELSRVDRSKVSEEDYLAMRRYVSHAIIQTKTLAFLKKQIAV